MIKVWVSILLSCLSVLSCIAQDNNEVLSHIPQTGTSPENFIPKGYGIFAGDTADLNKDGKQDMVLVLRDMQEDTAQPGSDARVNSRLVVVLFKTANGWQLAAKSGEIVLCRDCGGVFGEPFVSIKVVNGVITIDHYGGSAEKWAFTRKFRYQNNDLYLIGATDAAFFGNTFCDNLNAIAYTSTDINLITGDREIKEITKDCKKVNKKDRITIKPLVKMADYKMDN